jgi:hypothetical protein
MKPLQQDATANGFATKAIVATVVQRQHMVQCSSTHQQQ